MGSRRKGKTVAAYGIPCRRNCMLNIPKAKLSGGEAVVILRQFSTIRG